jgi:hypothetical protein
MKGGGALSQQSERLAAGRKWFLATHPELTGGKVRVSKYFPAGKEGTWQHGQSTWAFEFPLTDLESAVRVTYCVCAAKAGGRFIYCLGVKHEFVLKHLDALYKRVDKNSRLAIGVFLAADSAPRFRDLRGPGGIDFASFLLP